MATHLRAEFIITGFIDGPVAQKLLDEGKDADWFANVIARELKALVEPELKDGFSSGFDSHIKVNVSAKLHESDPSVGEASTE